MVPGVPVDVGEGECGDGGEDEGDDRRGQGNRIGVAHAHRHPPAIAGRQRAQHRLRRASRITGAGGLDRQRALELGDHRASVGIASLRSFGRRVVDDRGERRRHLGAGALHVRDLRPHVHRCHRELS
jgi:hypothetical protein